MLKFARFLKQFKKEVLIGPVFKLTEAVFELIVPLVMAQIIDVGIARWRPRLCAADGRR